MSNESMDAFDRAFATSATGDPLVTPEQEKELNVDPSSAFDRAWETATVSTDNADVENEDVSFFQRVLQSLTRGQYRGSLKCSLEWLVPTVATAMSNLGRP